MNSLTVIIFIFISVYVCNFFEFVDAFTRIDATSSIDRDVHVWMKYKKKPTGIVDKIRQLSLNKRAAREFPKHKSRGV